MINKENLDKLYNGVLEDGELTTRELTGFGFNSKDLNELIKKGSIIRVKKGLYALKSVDELFYYGKQLNAQKEYDKAIKCFQKCFEIDSNHSEVCFELFLISIENKDYKKAFEYFNVLFNGINEFYNRDCNFYLYLLSMITEIPEEYKEYAKSLKFKDFKVDFEDGRYLNIHIQNKIRLSAFNQRFGFAVKQLKESIQESGKTTVTDLLIKLLLSQAIAVQIQKRNKIINFIKEKKYQELIDFYNIMINYHALSNSDNYIIKLTNDLLNIINTKKIPNVKIKDTKDVYAAIDGKNYKLALSLEIARNQKYNSNRDIDSIYLLLDEINKEINNLKDNVKDNIIKSKENNIIETKLKFIDVIKKLMNNDLDNALKSLRDYLHLINKSEYEFLIMNLIKISLLEKDFAFTKPMTVLTLVSRENYSFDISTYIQEFYINLSQNKFEKARIYLDIITNGNKLGQDYVITDGLYQVLETSEKMLDYKKNSTTLDVVDETLENSKKNQTINIQKQGSYTELQGQIAEPIFSIHQKPQVQHESIRKEEITQEKRDSEKKFMDKKYEELLDKKDAILLKPMNSERINNILKIIGDYQDMVAFVIGKRNQQQIVLRYKPSLQHVNVEELIKEGNKAYKEENYDECIEKYLQLLQVFKEPRAIIYAKLGLAYMKKMQIQLAIDYLTIATDLSQKENVEFDFSCILSRLKGDITKEDSKPYFKMFQEDFDYSDVNDYYGIDNFVEINSYINESGLDVDTACEQLGLSLEEIDIIKLIYAREFYTQGYYDKGDIFLKAVERSKNKTQKTKKIFEEIRKNKRFYQNRKNDNNTKLVLTLLPKK